MSSEKPVRGPSLEKFFQFMEVMDRHDRARIEGLTHLAEIHDRTAEFQEELIEEARAIAGGRQRPVGKSGAESIIESSRRGRLKRAKRTAADSRQAAVKCREEAALLQHSMSKRQLALSENFGDGRDSTA